MTFVELSSESQIEELTNSDVEEVSGSHPALVVVAIVVGRYAIKKAATTAIAGAVGGYVAGKLRR